MKNYEATVSQAWYGIRTDYTLNGKHVGYSTSNGNGSYNNWSVFNDIATLEGTDLRVCPTCEKVFYAPAEFNTHECGGEA